MRTLNVVLAVLLALDLCAMFILMPLPNVAEMKAAQLEFDQVAKQVEDYSRERKEQWQGDFFGDDFVPPVHNAEWLKDFDFSAVPVTKNNGDRVIKWFANTDFTVYMACHVIRDCPELLDGQEEVSELMANLVETIGTWPRPQDAHLDQYHSRIPNYTGYMCTYTESVILGTLAKYYQDSGIGDFLQLRLTEIPDLELATFASLCVETVNDLELIITVFEINIVQEDDFETRDAMEKLAIEIICRHYLSFPDLEKQIFLDYQETSPEPLLRQYILESSGITI